MWVTILVGLTSALNLSIVLCFKHQKYLKRLDNSSSSAENWKKCPGLVNLVERFGLYLGCLIVSFYKPTLLSEEEDTSGFQNVVV